MNKKISKNKIWLIATYVIKFAIISSTILVPNSTIYAERIDNSKQKICNATIDDVFKDDSITVVLSKEETGLKSGKKIQNRGGINYA